MPSDIAIGIDLGTTYSCVAVYQNKKVNVLTNAEGNRTTPSQVAYKDAETLVGNAAQNQAPRNPKNTIFNVKRMIGRRYDERELQSDLENFPFRVISKNEQPVIEVDVRGEKKQVTPEEVSSMVLRKMKETAERFLGDSVKNAVITVPAYFNDGQRQATKDAAKIAGLNVLRIINEPTAAALAFGLEKEITKTQTILVYDLGGGTFDVSILTIEPNNVFKVKATTGDTHFGGSDFDQKLLDYCANEFKKEHQLDITKNPRSMLRLRSACEKAKRSLSTNIEETIVVDALYDGMDFECTITRVKFEYLCADLFRKLLDPVKNALSDSKIDKSKIDEVVLVGGSTRIPKVQQVLRAFFDGKVLNCSINPDEAVAYGAAAQAAILSGTRFNSFGQIILRDVTPLSLGFQSTFERMCNVIYRNTLVPVKKFVTCSTEIDYQTSALIRIYEGERAAAPDNHKLGEFILTEIPPLPRGKAEGVVTFEIDEDGILTVTAMVKSTGKTESIVINKGRLDPSEIERMIKDAEDSAEADKLYRERVASRSLLENYAYEVRDVIKNNSRSLTREESTLMNEIWKREIDWLDQNKNATKKIIDLRNETFRRACEPLIMSLEMLNVSIN